MAPKVYQMFYSIPGSKFSLRNSINVLFNEVRDFR